MESGGDAGNWERLAEEYGDEWAAAVRALDATTQRVAVAAAERHRANLSEDIATGQIVTDFTGPTHGERPHADAPNEGHQAIRTLKDAGLWPWQLVRRVLDAEDGAARG
jgi:hypothetical protein